jgi:hypothetical protein
MIDKNLEKSLTFVDDLLYRCHNIGKKHFGQNVSPEIVIEIYHAVREQEEEMMAEEAYQSLKNQVNNSYKKALEMYESISDLVDGEIN